MSKIVTIMADGNSGVSGVGELDERGVGVAVGVDDGVGVGVLPTLKVATAVAAVAPVEAVIAAAEIV